MNNFSNSTRTTLIHTRARNADREERKRGRVKLEHTAGTAIHVWIESFSWNSVEKNVKNPNENLVNRHHTANANNRTSAHFPMLCVLPHTRLHWAVQLCYDYVLVDG